jgi:5'(3')-deoxyribonucleotidase
MFDELNEDNFMIYAMKAYNSPHCIVSEFESDIKRTKYLKRLFRRYKVTKSLKERLILNHIILLNNVFGLEATARILFYKIDERDYDVLKTFLSYLNIMPDVIYGIKGKNISTADIMIDTNIAEILRKI